MSGDAIYIEQVSGNSFFLFTSRVRTRARTSMGCPCFKLKMCGVVTHERLKRIQICALLIYSNKLVLTRAGYCEHSLYRHQKTMAGRHPSPTRVEEAPTTANAITCDNREKAPLRFTWAVDLIGGARFVDPFVRKARRHTNSRHCE
jgi:hypothetical protein